jgi:GMP synthase (glutamine-hydrolysing)
MRFSILKSGTASRATQKRLGDYDRQFVALLAQPDHQWDVHDVEHGDFPGDLSPYDGFVITGSPASAYDPLPWVQDLLKLVREIHAGEIALLGVCFGAQVVAQALGGEVRPNPLGWEVGLVPLALTEAGRADSALARGPQPLHILQTHQDVVTRLPAGATGLAASRCTPHEIFALGETVLCLQGHPEMDNEVVRELIDKRSRRGLLPPDRAAEGLASLRGQAHRAFLQDWLTAFLREGRLRPAA